VLDFAPLVQEFIVAPESTSTWLNTCARTRLKAIVCVDRLPRWSDSLLTYLHTRPMTSSSERVEVKNPGNRKTTNKRPTRSGKKDRRFFILPDLLAPRGAINFRVIGDDYYAVVPEGTDPTSSELRRAYLQYVIDALVLRFNKDIALKREQVKQLLTNGKSGAQVSPMCF
jgi:hypothetical protein